MARVKRELARVKKERDFLKRRGGVLRERVEVKYQAIEHCRDQYPIRMMCRCLHVSASGFDDWQKRLPSKRQQANTELLKSISNHLNRDFKADDSNHKWVTDITYIETQEGWLFCVSLSTYILVWL